VRGCSVSLLFQLLFASNISFRSCVALASAFRICLPRLLARASRSNP
jgi:hypothetical protein